MSVLKVTCWLLCTLCWANAASLDFINYWNGDMFQGRVTLTSDIDRTSGWQMILTFNTPVDSLTLWDQDVVEKRNNGKKYIIKNRSQSHVGAGSTYSFQFQGRYTGAQPTSGTVNWYGGGGGGGGVTTTTEAITTTTTTTTQATTSGPTNLANTYAQAIGLSWKFYEAQRSGVLPADNRIAYRGNSSVADGSPAGVDLSGGWHDAGDHVKFGLPMSASTTMLLHGLYFFKDAFTSAGQYNQGLRQIRWPLDYFLKCHQRSDRFYAQVGNGDIDHAWWGRPEDMDEAGLSRPVYVLGAGANAIGGADVMGESAAALAAGSLVFKQSDGAYSQTLLTKAVSLYNLAKGHPDTYNAAVPDGAKFYSSSGWRDEMAHAAAWLSMAHAGTPQQTTYRNEAKNYLDDGYIWALDWSDKRALVNLLLYHQTGEARFKGNIEAFLQQWLPGGSVPRTPGGLAYRLEWGSLRYSANSAFLALLAAKEGLKVTEYRSYAQSQIHYMLGLTGGRSFVVGFGRNPPKRPHHKAASCADRNVDPVCDWNDFNANADNPQILYGALVGGPAIDGSYVDDRKDFKRNEVACDYNAGFTGALAGLIHFESNPPAGK